GARRSTFAPVGFGWFFLFARARGFSFADGPERMRQVHFASSHCCPRLCRFGQSFDWIKPDNRPERRARPGFSRPESFSVADRSPQHSGGPRRARSSARKEKRSGRVYAPPRSRSFCQFLSPSSLPKDGPQSVARPPL